MVRFLANCEIEGHLSLAEGVSVLRHDHPGGMYTIYLRDLQVMPGDDAPLLSALTVFDASSLECAKNVGEGYLRDFLDYLATVTNATFKFSRTRQIFNWEPGEGMRECMYYVGSQYHDVPIPGLDKKILETVSVLQSYAVSPRLRRALKWFRRGVFEDAPDDQFFYFWLVIEVIAQLVKEPSPVPEKCPQCGGPLYCEPCGLAPLHRPFAKQAIQQLFAKYVKGDSKDLYECVTKIRHRLTHGDEVAVIEAALKIKLTEIVNRVGALAWTSIVDQFAPVLAGKHVQFAQTNKYVHMKMVAGAHMQVGFRPNFENPDPKDFPQIKVSVEHSDAKEKSSAAPETKPKPRQRDDASD